MATVVSIGRATAGGELLPDKPWQSFQESVKLAVKKQYGQHAIVFAGEGEGHYQGKTEPSFTVIVADEDKTVELMDGLRQLLPIYGQESIALTTGKTYLLTQRG